MYGVFNRRLGKFIYPQMDAKTYAEVDKALHKKFKYVDNYNLFIKKKEERV